MVFHPSIFKDDSRWTAAVDAATRPSQILKDNRSQFSGAAVPALRDEGPVSG